MVDVAQLSLFANYSNFYSILTVLVCFIVMVVFILRLNGENLLSSSPIHYNRAIEKQIVGLENPFSVLIQKDVVSSLQAGIYLEISLLKTCLMSVLWGVNIEDFQKVLYWSSKTIIQQLNSGEILKGSYLHKTDTKRLISNGETIQKYYPCPEVVTEETLGPPQRKLYPVVIIAGIDNSKDQMDKEDIVVAFTIIHLKDSMCPLDSHIVYQFLKTSNNQLLSLQPIFLVSPEVSESDVSMMERSPHFSSGASKNGPSQPSTQSPERYTSPSGGEWIAGSTCNNAERSSHNQSNLQMIGNVVASHDTEHFTSSCIKSSLSASKTEYHCQTLERSDIKEFAKAEDDEHEIRNHVKDTIKSCNQRSGSNHVDGQDYGECIVCQTAQIDYALLPCRHACICHKCFKLLDRCPICRGYIESYFKMRNFTPDEELQLPATPIFTRISDFFSLQNWEQFNRRLNEYLGFN
ncbi:hypothetical protein CHS0354_001514 [Potamilus streckersoni]|uniref:RING-type domain-containing protein n=1 Tax=Potamilus streckersoni TaxID=2493646 RepID=A0AAE0VJP9_9BIVA|nr:hypothetical protein CHS0354_001514 [Potamilus streckersoni]